MYCQIVSALINSINISQNAINLWQELAETCTDNRTERIAFERAISQEEITVKYLREDLKAREALLKSQV